MRKFFGLIIIITGCISLPQAYADPATLGWWFLPDAMEDLPLEIEEDDNGYWSELWLRPGIDSTVMPNEVMEQTLGARWVGLNPDKEGKPAKAALVLADNKYIEFSGETVLLGLVDGSQLKWSDGSTAALFELRRHRHSRRHKSAKINFGKITLPPLASRTQTQDNWSMERLPTLLERLPAGPFGKITLRDLSAPAQIYDDRGSFLNFRYAHNCDNESRAHIEDVLASDVEPRLSCWMKQNSEGSVKLLSALLQRPIINCKPKAPMGSEACGMASVPRLTGFFVTNPEIHIALDRCKGELNQTLLHETLHLAGVKEIDMDGALEAAESCASYPASLEYENQNEGFYNDFEIQTRIFLFRKVRDEAVEKWGWSEGERDFMLGTICSRMGDKYCSRNFFQKAVEENLTGNIILPEGTEVSWRSLAQYELYDSVTEDLQRMHELAKYLKRDPEGTLLRRIETGAHRLHEFFVARETLEQVKAHKGVCSSETDEHIFCEDLAQIVKTPWFKRP